MTDVSGTTGITLPPAGSVVLPARASTAQIDNYIRANFGYMAWALAVPELKGILEKAVGPNGLTMDQNTFDGLVRNTKWYENNTQAMRSWIQLQGEDPQTAQAQVAKQATDIQTEARMMGLNMSQADLNSMSMQAIAYQWDKSMMDEALYSETMRQTFYKGGQLGDTGGITGAPLPLTTAAGGAGAKRQQVTSDPFSGGTLNDYYSKVMQYANEYMVTISPDTAAQWAVGMSTGQLDPTAVEGSVIKMATGKFPTLASDIQAGITPKQVMDPVTQKIASTLEIPPDTIDYRTPQFNQVLQFRDPTTGQVRPMTESEADVWARTQSQWSHTQNFVQADDSMAKQLGTIFGTAKYG